MDNDIKFIMIALKHEIELMRYKYDSEDLYLLQILIDSLEFFLINKGFRVSN